MLTIIGQLQVRAERIPEFERLFRDYAQRVKANEPGALVYQLCRSRAQPGVYRVIEIYRDPAALAEHRAAAYFQPAVAAMGACLEVAARPEYFDVVE